YEAAPLAFLAEQAGGKATTGKQPVLQVQPDKIHMRSPLIIGSLDDVALVESFIQDRQLDQPPAPVHSKV
ncbi:MAG: class 1 fructose-bisphosphatase, partial [Cyanobacteria bacterium J06634_5]